MPDVTPPQTAQELHETDFVLWAEDQARRVRELGARGFDGLDWEHVAEELEDLVAARKAELRSRISTVIEHLLKLEFSPATAPRAGWTETVIRSRDEIDRLLEDSPSLRREVSEMVRREMPRTLRLTRRVLAGHGEMLHAPDDAGYGVEQILGDWFPPPPTG